MPMEMYTFLSSLPALLAVLAFVVFHLLRGRSSGRVTARIVDKLRKDVPESAQAFAGLKPAQLERRLEKDQDLRKLVDRQDFQLLRQALRQEFVQSLVVNCLAALLFTIGVGLFVYQVTRPKLLSVGSIHMESDASAAEGWAVDIDPLIVTWTSDGESEDVSVGLENVETGRISKPQRVAATAHRVTLAPGGYSEVLQNRNMDGINRVRVVIQGAKASFRSDEIALKVGFTILLVAVPSQQSSDAEVTVAAMIDQQRVAFYSFDAKVALFRKNTVADNVMLGEHFPYDGKPATVDHPKTIDWKRTKIIYLGPGDSRLVRIDLLIDDGLQ